MLGQTSTEFIEDYGLGGNDWMRTEFDEQGNVVVPLSFVPSNIEEHRTELEDLISRYRDDPHMMNAFLAVYSKLVEGDTKEQIAFEDLDLLPTEYAQNRLSQIMLWDDPSLEHHGYERVVEFLDGHIRAQMGDVGPEHVTAAPQVVHDIPKTVTTDVPDRPQLPQHVSGLGL